MPTTPSLNDIKSTTEKAEGFVKWAAEVLRGSNWVKKLLLIDVVMLFVFCPAYFPKILKYFTNQTLPGWYSPAYGAVVGCIFVAALIVACRAKPSRLQMPVVDFKKRSAIKCLRPFGFEDAELFSRLQREQDLHDCLGAIADREFRFGILCGESGCGKSSFLQAGLWPRLEQCEPPFHCLYVKLSDVDPVDSLRQALVEQFGLSKAAMTHADFRMLLESTSQQKPGNLVLLFDQFEQFFVHFSRREDREPFLRALSAWYQSRETEPARILISIRGDFLDRLIEPQKAMGYTLGTQNFFRLEKFTPEQAAEILCTIAEMEGIDSDERFVKEITEKELVSTKDGFVSPIDLQVLAWMIGGQRASDERAFNRTAYQKLGGVEGLLGRFLSRALGARETDARRQSAMKVMLALTDLERNTRAGMLSLRELQEKMAGTLSENDVKESIEWLARSDVRLVTPSQQNEATCYELAHERLIPALRRLAAKNLSDADRANSLLDRRVNEWLGNNRTSRYLFGWRELRLIKRQVPYLVWGDQKVQKDALLTASKRRLRLWWEIASCAAALGIFVLVLLFSPWGQIWLVESEMWRLAQRTSDTKVLASTAVTFTKMKSHGRAKESLTRALAVVEGLRDDVSKAFTMGEIAAVMAQAGDKKRAAELCTRTLAIADNIKGDASKASILGKIGAVMAQAGDKKRAAELRVRALAIAEGFKNDVFNASVLSEIAVAAARAGDTKQALVIAEKIGNDVSKAFVIGQIAAAVSQTGDIEQTAELCTRALAIADSIKDDASKASILGLIAAPAAQAGDTKQALVIAEKIGNDASKAFTIGEIAAAIARAGDTKQALVIAEKMGSDVSKAFTMGEIAAAAARAGDTKQALVIAEKIGSDVSKAFAMGEIAAAIARAGDTKQALVIAEKIGSDVSKAFAMGEIAAAAAQAGDTKQALVIAEKIGSDASKASVLMQISQSVARSGNWRMARKIVADIGNDQYKLITLNMILLAWVERGKPAPKNRMRKYESDLGM